jgi:hypothetical protein
MNLITAIKTQEVTVTAAHAELIVTDEGNFFVTNLNGTVLLYEGTDEETATDALLSSPYEQGNIWKKSSPR